MNKGCEYCKPDGDYWGYDIKGLDVITETTRGYNTNNGRAYLNTYGLGKDKEIVLKWSLNGRINKVFNIQIEYCPMCGEKL